MTARDFFLLVRASFNPMFWILLLQFVKLFLAHARKYTWAQNKRTLDVAWRCFLRGFREGRAGVTRREGDTDAIVNEEMGVVPRAVH